MDNYEQKYRESLKKAEAFYYSATTKPITEREVLANIFPELKESEDEKVRKHIIIALKSQKDELEDFYVSHNTSESELVAWLEKKELKKIEQKPTWGEDDEKMYLSIMSVLLSTIGTDKTGFTVTREMDWLKSLKDRYTWKPSDEQMEAMQKALVDLCGKDEHNIITGLYYDLKKLKGEE